MPIKDITGDGNGGFLSDTEAMHLKSVDKIPSSLSAKKHDLLNDCNTENNRKNRIRLVLNPSVAFRPPPTYGNVPSTAKQMVIENHPLSNDSIP